MRWPWSKREKRESSFTDALVAQILATASGASLALPTTIAALETAANLYARAFAAAKVQGPAWAQAALTPAYRAMIGRALIRAGEIVLAIDAADGELTLWPAADHDVTGGYDPTSWTYRLNLAGPSFLATRTVGAEGVVHVRYAADPARPWRGVGPLDSARTTGALAASLEQRLSEEAGGPVGHLLPIPADGGDGGDDDPLANLKADIRGAKGRPLLIETTSAGFGEGRANAPNQDWQPHRLGANPPATLPVLRDAASMAVLDACGVPRALAESADGTAAREGWRRFVMGSVEPLLAIVGAEMTRKLETAVSFDLGGLWAHDLQGRASAFQRLVAGGVSVNEALATSGLLSEE